MKGPAVAWIAIGSFLAGAAIFGFCGFSVGLRIGSGAFREDLGKLRELRERSDSRMRETRKLADEIAAVAAERKDEVIMLQRELKHTKEALSLAQDKVKAQEAAAASKP